MRIYLLGISFIQLTSGGEERRSDLMEMATISKAIFTLIPMRGNV